jgi:hypothetical protein
VTTGRPAYPESGPESVGPEDAPELPKPIRAAHAEALSEFDPYRDPTPVSGADLGWLSRTKMAVALPVGELIRLSHDGADRHDPRVVAALELLRQRWTDCGCRLEPLSSDSEFGGEQAAIWRREIERLLAL